MAVFRKPMPLARRRRFTKTFGQAVVAARKTAGLTQKAVAARLRRSDGRAVMPPYLNDLEHDRRHPPENTLIEQLAEVLKVSPDLLYFYARRLPANVEGDFRGGFHRGGLRGLAQGVEAGSDRGGT